MIHHLKRAFTLIELSAVIVIIGILIAGVTTANGLVKKSKIAAAQSLTKASPISGITDNALWLESSTESSFKDTESSTGDAVTTWYDQKNSVNKSSVVAVGTGPTYSNTINYIHAVKFSGSAANYLQVSDASFLNNTDYTIIVLEKRQSSTAGYFIGDSSVSTANQTLLLGYSADAAIAHSQGTGNAYTSNVSTYNSSTDTPRVFTFISDSTNGKKTYINGILAAQSSDTTKLSNITTLAIGKGYTGEIGEIAIFTRALESEEREATEDYLGKKYGTKINRTTTATGSCLNGIITTNGCAMDCSTASVVGLSSPSTVADGTSTTGTCGATGYAGTVALSCSAGTGVLSASPSMCGCNSGAGYSLSGGVCISNCSYNVTGGSPSTGTVASGSGIINCNTASNYSSSGFAYNCSGGTSITGTCACATGYTGANCSTCDTANNYVAGGGGTCVLGCTIPSGSGTTTTLVAPSTTTATCNSSGYSGTMTFSCNPGNAVNITTPCATVQQTCTGGNTIDTTTVPGSVIHIFTSNGTFTCPFSKTAQVLVVGGGGAGSPGWINVGGGGGGGGGVIYNASFAISPGNTPVTVGAGAPQSSVYQQTNGANGSNSVFSSLIAIGGGGGGVKQRNGSTGGSGGGAGLDASTTIYTGGAATSGQGNVGGNGTSASTGAHGAGGGGGAGGVGGNGTSTAGGAGGPGIANVITGSTVYYGAGGGGTTCTPGCGSYTAGAGGNGGGGSNGSAGAPNTGSGGGGAASGNSSGAYKGGAGGSGIVIVRYVN